MSGLNKQQLKASGPERGVHLVIAGAGTGKTVTLVQKVRSVIADGTTPEAVLVLTFSRKAAEELKERLQGTDGVKLNVTTGTFHSYALSVLRRFAAPFTKSFGFAEFPQVIDENAQEELIGALIKERRKEFLGMPDATVRRSLYKGSWSKEDLRKLQVTGIGKAFEELKAAYVKAKTERNLIDFDDIMNFCAELLEKEPALLNQLQSELDYILVDEYQDTSDDNFRLLWLLTNKGQKNLFVVGDDWQSIYGFRNAKVEYIINMKAYFPNVVTHKLTINYRSRAEIVSLSNKFIKGNKKRTRKKLVSFKGKGGVVKHFGVASNEAEFQLIDELVRQNSGEIAILYRNNWQGERIAKHVPAIKGEDRVRLLTMHGSKGLEFDTVIIAGVKDGIVPDRATPVDEERRLFYVALSRARERLYIIASTDGNDKQPKFSKELAAPLRRRAF